MVSLSTARRTVLQFAISAAPGGAVVRSQRATCSVSLPTVIVEHTSSSRKRSDASSEVDRDTGRGIGFIGESGGMELVRERSRGVRVARCLTVSDSYGLRVSTSGYVCHGACGCSDTKASAL